MGRPPRMNCQWISNLMPSGKAHRNGAVSSGFLTGCQAARQRRRQAVPFGNTRRETDMQGVRAGHCQLCWLFGVGKTELGFRTLGSLFAREKPRQLWSVIVLGVTFAT
eukprot:scaffold501_cov105-Isochrysis_galbana.AAC.6